MNYNLKNITFKQNLADLGSCIRLLGNNSNNHNNNNIFYKNRGNS